MSVKLIALGNVLMKDDAVAIEAAKMIEEKLMEKGIEVIYGETDFQYCFSKVKEEDFIFILDAASYGKRPGDININSLNEFSYVRKNYTQHSYSFLDLMKLYYVNIQGWVIGIEIKEVGFGIGLSPELKEKLEHISEEILNNIEEILKEIVI